MRMKWILKNGASKQEFDSFPYAFRTMFAIAKKAVESPNSAKVINQLLVISPQLDRLGEPRTYSYAAATEMAKASGLLTPNGEINSHEFKKKYFPRGQQ